MRDAPHQPIRTETPRPFSPSPIAHWLSGRSARLVALTATGLGRIDKRAQTRLDVDACLQLEEELMQLMALPLPDEPRTAARRVLARAREVRPGGRVELVVEGPESA